jgi:protein-tyrosine phosphatase
MIDLHSHVLPGLDDGARDVQDSLDMLASAAADGIRTIVGTPHYDLVDPGRRALAADRLRRAAAARGLPVEVQRGFELAVSPAMLDLEGSARELGINGSRYLLIELPVPYWPPFIGQVFFRLRKVGLRPILAHAERYEPIMHDLEVARDLVRGGVLLQVNASSLLNGGSRSLQRCARELLREGLVSFLASDAHSPVGRAPKLRAAVEAAARMIGPSAAEALVTSNPAAVLVDAELPATPPIARRRTFAFLPWR